METYFECSGHHGKDLLPFFLISKHDRTVYTCHFYFLLSFSPTIKTLFVSFTLLISGSFVIFHLCLTHWVMFGLGGSFGSTKTPITAVELEWVDGLNGRIRNPTLSRPRPLLLQSNHQVQTGFDNIDSNHPITYGLLLATMVGTRITNDTRISTQHNPCSMML